MGKCITSKTLAHYLKVLQDIHLQKTDVIVAITCCLDCNLDDYSTSITMKHMTENENTIIKDIITKCLT